MAVFDSRTIERFWSMVDKNGPNGCWDWTGRLRSEYGWFEAEKKGFLAHRFAWTIENGPIPDGLKVLHGCDRPRCVRHLFLGSVADNTADMMAKGRGRYIPHRGESNGKAKINSLQALEIKTSSESLASLARRFQISAQHASKIRKGKKWAHILENQNG